MTIKTKYNIGDEFWVMMDNKPISFKVTLIHISIRDVMNADYQTNREVTIVYESNIIGKKRVQVEEKDFYATKQFLIATL